VRGVLNRGAPASLYVKRFCATLLNTQTHRLTDTQTDSFSPVILLAQPAYIKSLTRMTRSRSRCEALYVLHYITVLMWSKEITARTTMPRTATGKLHNNVRI